MAAEARYRIIETIGSGGMGEVCLAEDLILDRKVALKFVAGSAAAAGADQSEGLEQLLSEARAAAALDHPFICCIYEVTSLHGRPCIAMEYVRGESLDRRLRGGALTVGEALRLAEEIAEALDAAHKRRVVHRDLKPANVIVTEDGHVKVMDFGLAMRLPQVDAERQAAVVAATTENNTLRGTPAYMAPEHIRGGPADRRSDIFAFGILLYEMLSGSNPFIRLTVMATLMAILDDRVAALHHWNPGISPDLDSVVMRLLEKDPVLRYQSFGEVRADLRRVAVDAAPAALPSSPVPDRLKRDASAGFVGREAERTQLLQSLEQARSGRGSLMLLFGEPGVGKTRLADEVLATARQFHCQTLVGRCSQQEGTPALVPYVEILEEASRLIPAHVFRRAVESCAPELAKLTPELHRLFPDMAPPLDLPPELRQRFLFTNVRDFLARSSQFMPLVMFIDDLQWADRSTLQLTQHLAQQIHGLPILMIGAFRESEPHPAPASRSRLYSFLDRVRGHAREALSPHDIKAALDSLVSQRQARPITLHPFTEPEVQMVLAAIGQPNPPSRLVRKFADHTGGNPFFLVELFRHLHDDGRLFDARRQWTRDVDLNAVELPETVRVVLERRLLRLSAETLTILKAAAVIGRDVEPDALETVAAIDGDALMRALDEAEQARILKGPSGRRDLTWRFAHELTRQLLLSAIPLLRRQRLHLRAAEAMARLSLKLPVYTSAVAHHLYCAGRLADPVKTARALVTAGEAARAVYATEEATEHYRRALEVLQDTTADERVRLSVQETLADLLAFAGDRAGAMEHYERVGAAFRTARATVDSARIARKAGTLHWQAGDRGQAMAAYKRALNELTDSAAHIEMAQLYQELGLAAFRSGENAKAIEWAERALVSAEHALNERSSEVPHVRRAAVAAIAHATNTIGVALARSGQVDAARERIERSLATAQEVGLLDVACRAYANLGVLYSSLEPKRAIEVSLTGLQIASRIGAASLQSYIYANLAAAYCALTDGCETDGLQAAEASASLDRQLGQLDHLAVPLIVTAQIHQCRGELQSALAVYQEALVLAEKIGEPQLILPCYDGLATIHLDRGDRAQAQTYMEKGRELCERTGLDPDALLLLPFLC